jgi:hypothetical protein
VSIQTYQDEVEYCRRAGGSAYQQNVAAFAKAAMVRQAAERKAIADVIESLT